MREETTMRNLLAATIALIVGTVGYNAAWAQDTTQGSTVAEKPFTISLTPRLWYQIANGNKYQSNSFSQATVDQTNFADYGLSVEVSARSLPDWSFILTGYYGAGSVPARSINFLPQFFTSPTGDAVATSMQSSAFRRYDVEFLARYLVAPTISVTGGFRIFDFNDKVTTDQTDIFPNATRPNLGQSSVIKEDSKFYLEEIGVLFSTPFSASGRHLLFGGTTLGLGVVTFNQSRYDFRSFNNIVSHSRTSNMNIAATLDVYAGYQFLLTQSVALNIRYRAIVVSAPGQIPGQVTVNHGPEIGITTRF
jgi:hypothetical protein